MHKRWFVDTLRIEADGVSYDINTVADFYRFARKGILP